MFNKISMNPERIQKIIRKKKIDALFVSNLKNLRYLTGFTGSSGFALITKDKGIFFTDFRYKEQSAYEVKDWEIFIEKGKRANTIRRIFSKLGIKKLGFESSVSYIIFDLLRKNTTEMVPQKNLVERLRTIKNEEEIGKIKRAVQRAEEAFLKVKPFIRPGASENGISLRLEYQLKKSGCREIPFNAIVASGKNSSMPHAKPTNRKIQGGDFVIIDWGGESDGYFSDMTRTLLMDANDISEKKKIYGIVNSAREKAIMTAKEGVKAKEIDAAARDFIKQEGYSGFFGHATGHGVGLDIHESPGISMQSSESIAGSMVFTVEPGIYIPGIGGVRIEDMVTIQNGSAIILTSLPTELEIVKKR